MSVSSVTVVDYGLGNLHSVIKALAHVGADVSVAADGAAIAQAQRLVLPGVGAFADGMKGLTGRGQAHALRAYAQSGRPLLGICLGMQLLFDESDEYGVHTGLGIIPGRVERIGGSPPGAKPPEAGSEAPEIKVPHVGWNRLDEPATGRWTGSLLAGTMPGAHAYFVHSYVAVPRRPADLLAVTTYGPYRLCAAVAAGNVAGCQFHPEKSGVAGLAWLRAFLTI